jgi:putative Ca2+/H+ antiporter (TMEM165/GDT1 family)
MDWHRIGSTFVLIFLAEMGDKTQLAAMTLAAETGKPWAVFVGASLALVVVSALGVVAGGAIGRYVPLVWVKRGAALLFVAFGVFLLLESFERAK